MTGSRRHSRTAPFQIATAPGHLIRRAQQLHTEWWSALVGGELTSPQFAVLNELDVSPGIEQTRLGELVSLDTSTCQDVVARLRRRGLVERVRDPNDGRRWLLELSREGRRLHRQLLPQVRLVGEQLFAPLDNPERVELRRLRQKMLGGAPFIDV